MLKTMRDVVVLFAGVAFILSAVAGVVADYRATQVRAARLTLARQQITALDGVYKTLVFEASDNKGIYHQIFRQNEILIEYQKLLLLRDLVEPDQSILTPDLLRAKQP